jgi:hypothetical protein
LLVVGRVLLRLVVVLLVVVLLVLVGRLSTEPIICLVAPCTHLSSPIPEFLHELRDCLLACLDLVHTATTEGDLSLFAAKLFWLYLHVRARRLLQPLDHLAPSPNHAAYMPLWHRDHFRLPIGTRPQPYARTRFVLHKLLQHELDFPFGCIHAMRVASEMHGAHALCHGVFLHDLDARPRPLLHGHYLLAPLSDHAKISNSKTF